MTVVEYKRFATWREVYEEEKNFSDKMRVEGNHKVMEEEDIIGKAVESALNRLGDEGWILVYIAPHGIYFQRVTTEKSKKESWGYPTLQQIFAARPTEPDINELEGKDDGQTGSEVPPKDS